MFIKAAIALVSLATVSLVVLGLRANGQPIAAAPVAGTSPAAAPGQVAVATAQPVGATTPTPATPQPAATTTPTPVAPQPATTASSTLTEEQIAKYDALLEDERIGSWTGVMSAPTPAGASEERASRLEDRGEEIHFVDASLASWDTADVPPQLQQNWHAIKVEMQRFRTFLATIQAADRRHTKPFQDCPCHWRTLCYDDAEFAHLTALEADWRARRDLSNRMYEQVTGTEPIDDVQSPQYVGVNEKTC